MNKTERALLKDCATAIGKINIRWWRDIVTLQQRIREALAKKGKRTTWNEALQTIRRTRSKRK